MAERNVPGQLGLFKPTKTPDEPADNADGSTVWVYPCALCEAAEVDQAGALCTSCAPIPTPRPSRRRATKNDDQEASDDGDQADRDEEGRCADGCAGAALMASRGMDPRIRTEAFKIGFATVLAAWLVKHLAGGVWWLVRQPVLWVLAASAYVGWRLWDGSGPTALVLVAVALVVVLAAWRLVHPSSFRAWVWWPVRAWWRRIVRLRPGVGTADDRPAPDHEEGGRGRAAGAAAAPRPLHRERGQAAGTDAGRAGAVGLREERRPARGDVPGVGLPGPLDPAPAAEEGTRVPGEAGDGPHGGAAEAAAVEAAGVVVPRRRPPPRTHAAAGGSGPARTSKRCHWRCGRTG